MSSDENKGDFAILESTISLIERKTKDIVIINADYTTKICKSMKWMNNLGYKHLGALLPRELTKNRLLKAAKYAFKFFLSLYSLLIIYLFQREIKKFIYLLPINMREPVLRIINSDLIILKGGSYLYSHGKFKNFWFLYRMVFSTIISIFLRKKIYALGISLGALEGNFSKYILNFCLLRIDKLMFREGLSFKIAKKFTGRTKNLYVLPDLAFYKPKCPAIPTKELFRKEDIPFSKTKLKIGITAREWHFPEDSKRKYTLLEKYRHSIIKVSKRIITEYSGEIYFMPHYLGDLPFEERLAREIGSHAYVLKGDYSTGTLRTLYNDMDYFIGTRLHSCILSLSMGTPVIHIAYDREKGFGTFKLLDMYQFVLDIYEITPQKLYNAFSKLIENKTGIKKKIKKKVLEFGQSIQKVILNEL